MSTCSCETELPYAALRFVRAYKPRFRELILRFLREKQVAKPTLLIEDIQECIAMAYEVLETDMRGRVDFPSPDLETAELARQQAREGKGCTIQEFLDELH